MLADHADSVLQQIKHDALASIAAHPFIAITFVIGVVLVLIGLRQNNAGQTYQDEARAKRGTRNALIGLALATLAVWQTGALDPMIDATLTFWFK